jgi:O-antigen/teichoic acid export membrane protein
MSDAAVPTAPARSLRTGSLKVMGGVAFFGLSTYIFTVLTSRALGPVGFAEFSLFWGLTYGIGLGVSLPFEQETSRRVSALTARGQAPTAVLRAASGAAMVVALPSVVVLVPLCLALTPKGQNPWWLWPACSLAVVSLCVAYLVRGTLSGTHHFGSYATQFGVEGVTRLVVAVVLVVAGVKTPWAFAFVIPGALVLAVLLTLRPVAAEVRAPRSAPTDSTTLRAFLTMLFGMMIASTISMSLVNFGPVAVNALTPDGTVSNAGSFLAAALIARTPIFLFAAVQAVLIPKLVRAVVERDHAAFRATVRRVIVPTAGLGLLGILGCLVAGPEVLQLMSGPEFHLARTDITLLAVSTAFILGTLVLQPAAFALERHWPAVAAWAVAGLSFAATCLVPGDPVRVVGIALCISAAVATAGLAVVVNRGMRH